MKSRSFLSLSLIAALVLGFGLVVGAQEPEAAAQDADPVFTEGSEEAPSADSLLSLQVAMAPDALSTQSALCATPSQLLPETGSAMAFGFPLCTSQAHCESICAPYGGICWRQFCICD